MKLYNHPLIAPLILSVNRKWTGFTSSFSKLNR